MTVVGVDLSTFRVDTAWMSNGQPCRWHIELGDRKVLLIDRVRAVHMQWPLDVTEVCIEYPFGPNRRSSGALMAVVGAITRSVPKQARCAWPSSNDLRKAIGSRRDTKEAAHDALTMRVPVVYMKGWNEHELDALVACLGWTAILDDKENRA